MRGPAAVVSVVGLAATLSLAGCTAQRAYQEDLAETEPAAEHFVHTERLQRVMRGLDRLTSERPPQELDLEAASDAWLEELVTLARAIASSAEDIPQAAWADGSLTTRERAEFHRRAALLRERALALADTAPEMTLEQRQDATAQLLSVCEGCHADFRDRPQPSG